MNFAEWDKAIAARLDPVRTELSNIPVAALPREAGEFGSENFQSIDWLFPEYNASPSNYGDRIQDITVTLAVRLYFKKRYPETTEKDVLEWAELQILNLLTGFRLPSTNSNIKILSGRLFAPEQGQWYKELTFNFVARLIPSDAITPFLPVQIIGGDDQGGELFEVQS